MEWHEMLGIPTISISWGAQSYRNDLRISRIRTNTALRARGLTSEILLPVTWNTPCLNRVPGAAHPTEEEISHGRRNAAERICMHLERAA